MNRLLPLFLLLSLSASGFDALRKGPEPFTGTVKPYVPGYYKLKLIGSKRTEVVEFKQELFCTEFPLAGKKAEKIQWISSETNFTRLSQKYIKEFLFDKMFVCDRRFGFPKQIQSTSEKKMLVMHFEPDFEDRHSFAFRIMANNGGELFFNGRRIEKVPAGEKWLVRIPWWEMRSLPSKAVLVIPKNGTALIETTRLHGVRFLETLPDNPANTDWPRAVITNGALRAEFALPDSTKGFYRGCRFQSAGMITDFPGFGANYFPGLRDPRNHDDAAGQAEEFVEVPDFESPHNVFMKIGVGLLQKSGKSYFQMKNYRVAKFFPWKTELHPNRAIFRQKGESPAGFAYTLTKTISLSKDSLEMEYRLENTGRHSFETTEYAHNFLRPAKLIFPDGEFIPETVTRYLPLANSENGTVLVEGKTILQIRETNGPFRRAVFFTERGVSPEFFRKIKLAPGEYAEWKRSYTVLKSGTEK